MMRSYLWWINAIKLQYLPTEDPQAKRKKFLDTCKQTSSQSALKFHAYFRSEIALTSITSMAKQTAAFIDAVLLGRYWKDLHYEYTLSNHQMTLQKAMTRLLALEEQHRLEAVMLKKQAVIVQAQRRKLSQVAAGPKDYSKVKTRAFKQKHRICFVPGCNVKRNAVDHAEHSIVESTSTAKVYQMKPARLPPRETLKGIAVKLGSAKPVVEPESDETRYKQTINDLVRNRNTAITKSLSLPKIKSNASYYKTLRVLDAKPPMSIKFPEDPAVPSEAIGDVTLAEDLDQYEQLFPSAHNTQKDTLLLKVQRKKFQWA